MLTIHEEVIANIVEALGTALDDNDIADCYEIAAVFEAEFSDLIKAFLLKENVQNTA